ncbi:MULTISPECIES: hypothetical protein [Achromobacter]|uniref:hypothetical protein n=1 Tax=Achromobacter TaxID=222 RepID=UPI0006C3247F|nr:hypothetical protein [Achromobacter xylosoxidans]CUJ39735.1 Uncharacterised protein [Achromobacter xylosoxidans]
MKIGPSLYYASDKNIFEALNQSKVDQDTLQGMFRRRNIVCSKQTRREDLALFFSRLTHDSIDHQDLSRRLGVNRRQERVTALDLKGNIQDDAVERAIEVIRQSVLADGDSLQAVRADGSMVLNLKYTEVDFKKSEFGQVQQREGYIELIRNGNDLVVRSTQSNYIEIVRNKLVHAMEVDAQIKFERSEVSLFYQDNHGVRSKFFYDLMMNLPGYAHKDVTDVFVYKAKPGVSGQDDSVIEDSGESHIEKVLLRGNGVSRSDLLRDLTQEKSYYIVKVGWMATEILGKGYGFDIEAMFANPAECTGFSYILHGVHELDDSGRLLKHRRSPSSSEIDAVARAIETRSRELVRAINNVNKRDDHEEI